MKKILFIFSFFLASNAYASDMGNGPAGLAALIIGTAIAIAVSYLFSANRNEDGSFGKVNVSKFIVILFLSFVLVIAGAIYATFA